MTPEQKLKELGIDLPAPAAPIGAYVPAVRTGNLVFTAGQLPMKAGALVAAGKVPTEVPLEQAQLAARTAVVNALAAVKAVVGSLDAVVRIVRLNVFVNSAAGFTQQAAAANGASELLAAAFGDAGRHVRTAVGVNELPLDSPVELELLVQIKT